MSQIPSSSYDPTVSPNQGLDEWVYNLVRPSLPWFHATGHTPNTLTTYSFLLGLAAAWALWTERPGLFVLLFALSYLFDCMDGEYARQYGMTSRFGDWYDHITDWVVTLIVAFVVWWRRGHTMDARDLTLLCSVLLVVAVGMGCVQRQRRQQANEGIDGSAALDFLTVLCSDDHRTSILQRVGVTTFIAILVGYIYWCFRHRSPVTRCVS